MKDHQGPTGVNFVDGETDAQTRRQTLSIAITFISIVVCLSTLGAFLSYRSVKHRTSFFHEFGALPVISDMRRLVFGADARDIIPSGQEGRWLRVLLLGIGGAGHDGSQLTDTIILATIDADQKRISLLSIPRDLAFPLGNNTFEKINALNAYEEQAHPGEGAERAAKRIGDLLDVSIDQAMRVDFTGFAAFVDALGGVDITVERSFVDPQYPTADEKVMEISFQKGRQHMDGKTALTFVRSRHGSNGEGSDFARSRRQQLVLLAVRDKLLSLNTLADPGKLASLYAAIANHVQSTLSPWEMAALAPLVFSIEKDQISQRQLISGDSGQLENVTLNGAFMLLPHGGDWSAIKQMAKEPFDAPATNTLANIPSVEIKNGTLHTGFASQAAEKLQISGFRVSQTGNASKRSYRRTTIYDLTKGAKTEQLERLRSLLDADLDLSQPSFDGSGEAVAVWGEGLTREAVSSPAPDFVVILGEATYPLP
jgi:LCP family protein required for cell wall assembly